MRAESVKRCKFRQQHLLPCEGHCSNSSKLPTIAAMLSSFRGVVLRHLRLPVAAPGSQTPVVPPLGTIIARGFGGGFLDKDKVTERVIYVAKHFEKVDPAKVCYKTTVEH